MHVMYACSTQPSNKARGKSHRRRWGGNDSSGMRTRASDLRLLDLKKLAAVALEVRLQGSHEIFATRGRVDLRASTSCAMCSSTAVGVHVSTRLATLQCTARTFIGDSGLHKNHVLFPNSIAFATAWHATGTIMLKQRIVC